MFPTDLGVYCRPWGTQIPHFELHRLRDMEFRRRKASNILQSCSRLHPPKLSHIPFETTRWRTFFRIPKVSPCDLGFDTTLKAWKRRDSIIQTTENDTKHCCTAPIITYSARNASITSVEHVSKISVSIIHYVMDMAPRSAMLGDN